MHIGSHFVTVEVTPADFHRHGLECCHRESRMCVCDAGSCQHACENSTHAGTIRRLETFEDNSF